VNSKRIACRLAVLALALSPHEAVLAQSPEEAIRACAAETDVLQRLACYDRAAAQLLGAPPPAAAAADGARSESVSPDALFGTRNGALDRRKYSAVPKEITARVSQIEMRRTTGVLVVTLDNEQVWMEDQPSAYYPLKIGDTVRIRAAALGSYMMFAPSKRTTRVTRIR